MTGRLGYSVAVTCHNCGGEYQTDRPHRSRYCSRRCQTAAHGRNKAGRANQAAIDGEIFKQIAGYDGYEVSNFGRVRNRGTILTPRAHTNGYQRITLCVAGVNADAFIHRLVLAAFCREPEPGEEGDHIDRNRANNALMNLRWLSLAENRARRDFSKRKQRRGAP